MIWIPPELILQMYREVNLALGQRDFRINALAAMNLDQEYYRNLLAYALIGREWTAIAQAELFTNLILRTRAQTGQFLEMLRKNPELRAQAEGIRRIRLGRDGGNYAGSNLKAVFDNLAVYCPNIVEVSCCRVSVELACFRMSAIV
jgi:hypothetical protein